MQEELGSTATDETDSFGTFTCRAPVQAKSKKKNNGLLVLASARGYLGDVRDLAQQVLLCLLMHNMLVVAQLPLAQGRLRMHSVQSV